MAVGKLPDDMWEAARVIWENTPKISDRDLIIELQLAFGDTAPKSSGTIAKRRKKENWQKKTADEILKGKVQEAGGSKKGSSKKNGSKKSENSPQSLENNKEAEQEAGSKNENNNEGGNETSTAVTIFQKAEERIYATAEKLVLDTQEKAKIIHKHRKRIKMIGELQETVLDTINNLHGLDPTIDGEKITQTLIVAETSSRVLNALNVSQKINFEQEMLVCGIKMTDFEMSEQERRMQSLAMLEGIEEQEREARRIKMQEMLEFQQQIKTMSVDEIASLHGDELDIESDYGDSEYEEIDDEE